MRKTEDILVFKDLKTGETWEHGVNDWILNFCNFSSEIHPSMLRPKQGILVKDAKGNQIRIVCERRKIHISAAS